MLSWVGMKTTDSALLGHVSAQALSAAALSDLVSTKSPILHTALLYNLILTIKIVCSSGRCVPLY